MRDGAIRDFTVQENLFLHDHASPRFTRGDLHGPARHGRPRQGAGGPVQRQDPGPGDAPQEPLRRQHPEADPGAGAFAPAQVLIASQPTRGVDIGATEYIHQRLVQQRDAGTAVLLISEDLDEVLSLSERIAVMYEGADRRRGAAATRRWRPSA